MNESAPVTRKGLALMLLAAAQFVVVLDASIVNVALPSMGKDLDFSQEDLSWVVNAYTLTFGGFLLLGGRLADLLGRRRVFVAGLILFSAASLAGGLAQSPEWLVAARAVQGLGAAILSPAALSIITTTFAEGAERNRAMGVWGAVAGSGGAAGVLFGGAPDRVRRLGVGPVRERPDRHRRGVLRDPDPAREQDRRPASLRRRRRGLDHRRPVAAGLRARRHGQRRLGLDPDAVADRGGARADRRPSSRSSCARRARWSPSGSSATGR